MSTDALQRAGSTDAGTLIEALEETQGFKGVTGEISFAPEKHVRQKGGTNYCG